MEAERKLQEEKRQRRLEKKEKRKAAAKDKRKADKEASLARQTATELHQTRVELYKEDARIRCEAENTVQDQDEEEIAETLSAVIPSREELLGELSRFWRRTSDKLCAATFKTFHNDSDDNIKEFASIKKRLTPARI